MRYDEGGEAYVQQAAEQALMTVDNWLHLRVPMQQVAHICCLRHRLTQAFAAKVLFQEPFCSSIFSHTDWIGLPPILRMSYTLLCSPRTMSYR